MEQNPQSSVNKGTMEENPPILEEIKHRFAPFLSKMFIQAFGEKNTEFIEKKFSIATPLLVSPNDANWKSYEHEYNSDADNTRFGEYTVNPETISINWEVVPQDKISVLNLEEMVGKTTAEVASYVSATYGATHHIPGIEYWESFNKNSNKIPDNLNDGSRWYLLGSVVRLDNGGMNSFFIQSVDGHLELRTQEITGGVWDKWDEDCRVVLVEK